MYVRQDIVLELMKVQMNLYGSEIRHDCLAFNFSELGAVVATQSRLKVNQGDIIDITVYPNTNDFQPPRRFLALTQRNISPESSEVNSYYDLYKIS
ncbi:MAG: hypothetical protein HRU19_33010 [Pseudobacteriovorax sp.]|nr:hypothetical protein [Pseudobacteriovorax sp.]